VCLAVPAKIVSLEADGSAEVEIGGVRQRASIELVPEAEIGSYVLIHAGFAISVLDPEEAEETLNLFREMAEAAEAEIAEGSRGS
jgi:hydrogenase expression/formation protein HypC